MPKKINSYLAAAMLFVAVFLFVVMLSFGIRLYQQKQRQEVIEVLHSEIK